MLISALRLDGGIIVTVQVRLSGFKIYALLWLNLKWLRFSTLAGVCVCVCIRGWGVLTCSSITKPSTMKCLCAWLQREAHFSIQPFYLVATASGDTLGWQRWWQSDHWQSWLRDSSATSSSTWCKTLKLFFPPAQRKLHYATLCNIEKAAKWHIWCEMDSGF